jgi:hypothetical protein
MTRVRLAGHPAQSIGLPKRPDTRRLGAAFGAARCFVDHTNHGGTGAYHIGFATLRPGVDAIAA